jgi:hypothetical protein
MSVRWRTASELNAQREAIARVGSVRDWIREGSKRKPISKELRAKRQKVNAHADEWGFPRPYPDLDEYPIIESEP